MRELITTGCYFPKDNHVEEFVLIGDWCTYKNGDSILRPIETFEYPFDKKEIIKANLIICDVYNRILPELMGIYNAYFKINKTEKYYEILIGRWLIHYLHNIYEKYFLLTNVSKLYGPLKTKTCGLKYYSSYDAEEYAQYSYKSHEFNFTQYSGILENLKEYHKEYIKLGSYTSSNNQSPNIGKLNFKKILYKTFLFINKLVGNGMRLVVTPYYTNNRLLNIFKMFVLSKFTMIDEMGLLEENNKKHQLKLDPNIREHFKSKFVNKNSERFENIAKNLLFYYIPLSFLEGFDVLREDARRWKKLYTNTVDLFFTANAIHTNTAFKYLVAESDTSKLYISQHGAGYGYEKILTSEYYERKLADVYFTWGWGKNILPHPKLLKNKRKQKNKILLTFPSVTIYASLMEVHYSLYSYKNIIEATNEFFDGLDFSAIKKVQIRQQLNDGLRIYSREKIKNDERLLFTDSLMESSLHVTNTYGTPFLESIAANIPTVLFYNDDVSFIRDSAKLDFETLKKNHIMFASSKDAAKHINDIQDDIEGWWFDKNVQAAVDEFRKKYCVLSESWQKEWVNNIK